jgi:hypothetical protein
MDTRLRHTSNKVTCTDITMLTLVVPGQLLTDTWFVPTTNFTAGFAVAWDLYHVARNACWD